MFTSMRIRRVHKVRARRTRKPRRRSTRNMQHPQRTAHMQHPRDMPRTRSTGAGVWYLVAVVAIAISADTSWRFFGQVLDIHGRERQGMFSVVELAFIACGWSMRAAVRRKASPGPARLLAWVLCGFAAYMAVVLSGPVQGVARVVLGPILGLVALHLALGIEIQVRAGAGALKGTRAKVAAELRERFLSRLGLGDDKRDALTRTRDRATVRAAWLASSRVVPFRGSRLVRALRVAGVAGDRVRTADMLRQIAVYRHAKELRHLDQPSPWQVRSVVVQHPDMQHVAPPQHPDTQHVAPPQHGAPLQDAASAVRRAKKPSAAPSAAPNAAPTDAQICDVLRGYVQACNTGGDPVSARHLVKLAKAAYPDAQIGPRRCSRIAEQIQKGGAV